MHAQMKARMDAEGLPYGSAPGRKQPPGPGAGQVGGHAAGREAIHDALFPAYFARARDISQPAFCWTSPEVSVCPSRPPASCSRNASSRRRSTRLEALADYGITACPPSSPANPESSAPSLRGLVELVQKAAPQEDAQGNAGTRGTRRCLH